MKKFYLTLIAGIHLAQFATAQNTSWPGAVDNANVGVGTTSALHKFHISQDITMNDDINVAQFGITGSSDSRKRLILGYDVNGSGFGYIKSGFWGVQWTSLCLQPEGGAVGIGTTSPNAKLHIRGGGMMLGNSVSNNTDGALSLGDVNANYNPTTANWSGTGTALTLNAQDYSTIGFHDSEQRVDFIRAGQGTIQLGYDGGWGMANIGLPNGIWNASGNVGIGTTDTKGYKLAIAGSAIAESLKIKLQGQWPDYVFKKDYQLLTLSEVKAYIEKNQRLPEMPSETEVMKEGINVGEMNKLLLRKVEELTLYLVEKEKQLEIQKKSIEEQSSRLDVIEKLLSKKLK
jgi:hypothetical protein